MARLTSLGSADRFITSGPPRVFIDGEEITDITDMMVQNGPLFDNPTIRITTRNKEKHMSSSRVSLTPSASHGPSGDHPEVRQRLADLIASALRNHAVEDISDALVLSDEKDNDGPLGGRSSSVLAYVTMEGETEPVAVSFNIYADDRIAEKAEERLDEIEAQTALSDRLDRVRALLGGDAS